LARQFEPGKRELVYDARCELSDLNEKLMAWYETLEPFGASFPVPSFLFKRVELAQIRKLQGNHLKLVLKQDGNLVDAIYFSPPSDLDLKKGSKMDMIGQIQWNYYRGQKKIQIVVQELKGSH